MQEAKEKFQQLQKVISILGDEEKRALYDQTGCIDDDVSNVVATCSTVIVVFLIDIDCGNELIKHNMLDFQSVICLGLK